LRRSSVEPVLVESQKPALVGTVFTLPKAVVQSTAKLDRLKPVIAADDVAIVNVVPVVPGEKPGTAPAASDDVRLVIRILNGLPLLAVILRGLPETAIWS
jgi:hypothetical protein